MVLLKSTRNGTMRARTRVGAQQIRTNTTHAIQNGFLSGFKFWSKTN